MINLPLKEILDTKYVRSIAMVFFPFVFATTLTEHSITSRKRLREVKQLPGTIPKPISLSTIHTQTTKHKYLYLSKGGYQAPTLELSCNSPGRCTHTHLSLFCNQECSSYFYFLSYTFISYVRQKDQSRV